MLTDGKSTSGGLSRAMTAEMNHEDLVFAAQGDAHTLPGKPESECGALYVECGQAVGAEADPASRRPQATGSGIDAFSLLDKPWIPVLYADGRFELVGIRTALEGAGAVRQIAAPNPMDRVALLRFLLAVLSWRRVDPLENGELDRIITDGRFPAGWFDKLDEHRECFNLLGDGKRLYQDRAIRSLAEKGKLAAKSRKAEGDQSAKHRDGISFRPVGDLFQEFPTDTKIIHFRHVRDEQYGFCPACCAVGLIRFSAFASAYAQVIPAGINGPTPAYAIRNGPTLLATLLLNWPPPLVDGDAPTWDADRKSPPAKNIVGPLAAFTWQPRRIWLGELSEELGICACCGEKARSISRIAFGPGWKSPFTASGKGKRFWPDDPNLVLDASQWRTKPKRKGSQAKPRQPIASTQGEGDGQPIGFPSPDLPVGIHARFWRTALRAVLSSNSHGDRPNALHLMGPAANKALYQDAAAIWLPSVADAEKAGASKWLETVGRACESMLLVLRKATPNPERQHPNRKGALEAMTASLEAELQTLFSRSLSSVGAAADLKRTAEDEFAGVISHVVGSTTSGSPFRRRQANRQAESLLRQAFEKIEAEEQ